MFAEYKTEYEKLLSLTNLSVRPYTDSKTELKRSLERISTFLETVGSPEKKLKIIHVAGTSGKGSVVNMLREILHEDGRAVGAYLSPHTTTYLERFFYKDTLIDPEVLGKSMKHLLEKYEHFLNFHSTPLSFFELSTCLAFYALKQAGAEWLILETGCGGRFDATNIIPTPRVAVITNIGKDHTEFLGNTLSSIATAKAGIIKKGGTVFCGETRPSLKKIFCKEAIKQDSALFFVPPPSKRHVFEELGAHQQHNAAVCMKVARELGIEKKTIQAAFRKTKTLPCRFELIEDKPRIILDGAHSPKKIEATVTLVKTLPKPIHIVFGCTATKDAEGMLKILSKVATRITTTRFKTSFRKAALPHALIELVPEAKQSSAFLDFEDALKHAKKRSHGRGTIVVTGSLYLAGEIRSLWVSEEDILKSKSSAK